MTQVVVATHNKGKLVEIQRILAEKFENASTAFEFVTAGELGLPDVVENGVTFEENALIKARDVAQRTGLPAMADDSGLIVDVMGRAPGILSARWAGAHGDDDANIDLLLAQLSDIPDEHRAARFCCAAALVIPHADGRYSEYVETGELVGVLIRERRGTNGFGYDPIFVPNEQPKQNAMNGEALNLTALTALTNAELSPEQKNAISHRGKAIRALAEHFSELV